MSETPRTQQLIDIANDEGISDAAVALVLQEHSEELEREIAEARARIDILERAYNDLIEEQAAICAEGQSIAELVAEKNKQLAEARADAEHWKSECNALQRMVHEARAEIAALKRVNTALNEEIKIRQAYVAGRDNTIERQAALIKQMKADLQRAKENFEAMYKTTTTQCAPASVAKAAYNTGMSYLNAALAAERGE